MLKPIFTLLLVMLFAWPSYAENAKVGIVDGEKLFDSYSFAQEATKKIADAQDELRNAIADSEKAYSDFEKQKKSEAEKLTKKKELQNKIDIKAQETRKMIETISTKIEDDIVQAIKKVSQEKGIEVVFDKRAVLFGGSDITDAVSETLKKSVPIAGQPLDSQAKKEAKKQ